MLVYEPYEMNMGISVAANLREAFKVSELLQSGYKRLLAEIDTPVMLMPVDDFGTQDIETLYHHTYHRQGNEEILSSILPDLNAIAVFAINKRPQARYRRPFQGYSYTTAYTVGMDSSLSPFICWSTQKTLCLFP